MTAVNTAGAASHGEVNWQTIDWRTVHQNVRRLQARIVKAWQEGRWGKVKALQHLLTHSFSGRALAVKRVSENPGKRTPGIDGVVWDTPVKKAQAINRSRHRGYRPLPLRRVQIPKSNGKKRPLGILTMQDRAMQILHLLALDPIAECTADPNSYGFRSERSTADAMQQCHTVLSNHRGAAEWVLEGDIKSCFDKISHSWLEGHVPMDKRILRKWLKAGYIEKSAFHETQEGVVQGGPISPTLANLTLDGLERKLREKYPKASDKSRKAKANLVRFADDLIITGSSKELLESEVKPLVEDFLKERGLELSAEKTQITHVETGFDFLGQQVRKCHGKIIIKPSAKSVTTFLSKVREVIKANAQAKTGHLIAQLNPIIRGWANYHRSACSKRTFVKVDHAIFQTLWRWARRRHPNKPRRWVKDKYFHHIDQRKWVFCGEAIGRQGKPYRVRLFSAAEVAIKRHRKIKGEANPYDPAWEMYFEQRLGVKMASDLKGRRQLLYLWREQNGLCPVCRQPITNLTGWHNHHLVWKSHGGSDTADNRVLLHPNCHHQVHHLGLTVSKPCPATGV